MCKRFSGGNSETKKSVHPFQTSSDCASCHVSGDEVEVFIWNELCQTPLSPALPCLLTLARLKLLACLWHQMFYYHVAWKRCNCRPEDQDRELNSLAYPFHPPFQFGEITGHYLGWIDEVLAKLFNLLIGILGKFHESQHLFEKPLVEMSDILIKEFLMLVFEKASILSNMVGNFYEKKFQRLSEAKQF